LVSMQCSHDRLTHDWFTKFGSGGTSGWPSFEWPAFKPLPN